MKLWNMGISGGGGIRGGGNGKGVTVLSKKLLLGTDGSGLAKLFKNCGGVVDSKGFCDKNEEPVSFKFEHSGRGEKN